MTTRSLQRVTAAAALVLVISACGDASTAPSQSGDETVVISVAGISADAAGIVLRLSGGVEGIDVAQAPLDVAWAADDPTTATVAVLGPIAELSEILIVRRRAGIAALSVRVIEVTDADGTLSLPTTVRVVVTGGI